MYGIDVLNTECSGSENNESMMTDYLPGSVKKNATDRRNRRRKGRTRDEIN